MNNNSDYCTNCAKIGITSKLRVLYIDLEETITLCDNSTCMHPLSLESKLGDRTLDILPKVENNLQNSSTSEKTTNSNDNEFSFLDDLLAAPVNVEHHSDLVALLDNKTEIVQNDESHSKAPNLSRTPVCDNSVQFRTVDSKGRLRNLINNLHNTKEQISVKASCKGSNAVHMPVSTTNVVETQHNLITNLHEHLDTKKWSKSNPSPTKGRKRTLCESERTKQSVKKQKTVKKQPHCERNDIFAFLESATSFASKGCRKPRQKKPQQPRQKKCAKPVSSSDTFDSNTNSVPLVRQWLAKQPLRRAFPGYRSKATSVSMGGTSDGRSASDSIPPSPSSFS